MLEISSFEVLEAYLLIDSVEKWQLWLSSICSLLVNLQVPLTLVTLGPNKNSVGYDVGVTDREGKFNSTHYLLTRLEQPTLEQIAYIISEDHEFYLGYTALTPKTLSDIDIQQLIISWDKNLVLSGIELFKMACDGSCFYWYNPTSREDALNQLGNLKKIIPLK